MGGVRAEAGRGRDGVGVGKSGQTGFELATS